MSQEFKFKDAKRPLTLHVQEVDIKGAMPGDSKNCVLTRAGRREHKCFDITILRTVAYVRFSERSIPLRYQVTASARDLIMAFDASGRTIPITVTLAPPRYGISHRRYVSASRKKAHARSKKKRDRELSEGGTGKRNAYTKPNPVTLFGVRNGSGIRPPGSGRQPRL